MSLFNWPFRLEPTSFVSALVILSCPALACAKDVNWDSLNLSPQQETQIDRLEDSWEKTHAEVGSQIERDTSELRAILPTGDTQHIRQLQNRITANKMFLMNQSMDTFLRKRETLTPGQRVQLQKIIPAKYHN
jgi:Spy/CpxP family protein refolding chaperone